MQSITGITDRVVAVKPALEKFMQERDPAMYQAGTVNTRGITTHCESSQTWDDKGWDNSNWDNTDIFRDWADRTWGNG